MKKSIIAIFGCALLFAGCKEIGPPINLSTVNYTDTTYVLPSVPAADPHNVLVEEFTGQSCPNCPAAHTYLDNLASGGQMNILGLYIYGVLQANPPDGPTQDLRDSASFLINKGIYVGAVSGFGLPCAGIDRITYSGNLLQYISGWSSSYDQRKIIIDSVNLSLTSSFNVSDSTATIIATVTYLQNVSTAQDITLAIAEDSIVGYQEMPAGYNTTNNVDSSYVFNDVTRGTVSFVTGDPLLPKIGLKQAGLVDQRTYTYKVPSSVWNLAHCNVIGFVHYSANGTTQEVLQSANCKLTP